jgi:agmatinase
MSDARRMQPNRPDEAGYAGVGLTFGRVPLVLEPAGLAGADVVIVGAPFDEGVTYRPGTRFGPRAIRTAEDVAFPIDRPHMELGVDPYAELDVVDYGDVDVRPSDLAWSHAALRTAVAEILAADAVPIVLGGDHSLSSPVLAALAERFGADGFSVVHFDTHADTGTDEREAPHGIPFHRAVVDGHLDGRNIVQVGLRGAWPFPEEFQWMREAGFRWHTMGEIVERGLAAVVGDAIEHARSRAPRTYLTVDVDVLDPAFAPGTGTAEPGGLMTAGAAVGGAHRRIAARPLLDGRGRGLAAVRPRGHHRARGPARRPRGALGDRPSPVGARGPAGAPLGFGSTTTRGAR